MPLDRFSAAVLCLALGCASESKDPTPPDPNAGKELTADECRDGLDNDRDGKTDCLDPLCLAYSFCGLHGDAGTPLSPDSVWDLILEEAQVPSSTLEGLSWDPDSAPDLFVVARYGNPFVGPFRSPTVPDTWTPTWNRFVLMTARLEDLQTNLEFYVLEEDGSTSQIVGGCTLSASDVEAVASTGTTGSLTCPRNLEQGNAGFVLRWRLSAR